MALSHFKSLKERRTDPPVIEDVSFLMEWNYLVVERFIRHLALFWFLFKSHVVHNRLPLYPFFTQLYGQQRLSLRSCQVLEIKWSLYNSEISGGIDSSSPYDIDVHRRLPFLPFSCSGMGINVILLNWNLALFILDFSFNSEVSGIVSVLCDDIDAHRRLPFLPFSCSGMGNNVFFVELEFKSFGFEFLDCWISYLYHLESDLQVPITSAGLLL